MIIWRYAVEKTYEYLCQDIEHKAPQNYASPLIVLICLHNLDKRKTSVQCVNSQIRPLFIELIE